MQRVLFRRDGRLILEEMAAATPARVNEIAWIEAGNREDVQQERKLSVGDIRVAGYSADEIVLRLSSRDEGFLVIGNTWNPYWTAVVDGKARSLLRVNHAQLGLWTRGQEREVRLLYRPPYSHWAIEWSERASGVRDLVGREQQPFSNQAVCSRNVVRQDQTGALRS